MSRVICFNGNAIPPRKAVCMFLSEHPKRKRASKSQNSERVETVVDLIIVVMCIHLLGLP